VDAPSVTCAYCHAAIPAGAVDRQREIANCAACGRLNDVRGQLLRALAHAASAQPQPEQEDAALPRARPPVQLPPGMSMSFDEGGLFGLGAAQSPITIRRRWLRGKHWIFLLVCMAASVGVALLWQNQGLSGWSVVATLFVLSWDYNVTTMFVNSTVIRADRAGVDVKHGPIPSLFGRNQRLARDQVTQLFAANFGAFFTVKVQLSDGKELDLVRPLVSAEQALFVEQQLEKALGITDFAVQGELGTNLSTLDGKPVTGAGSGTALGCLIPVFIGGGIALFAFMAQSEVSGMLQASGSLGSWKFEPDDCSSGQLEGFAGVTLTSDKDRGREVRLIKDPVKGTLVVVLTPGSKNQLFDAEQCPVFLIDVERSNTQINDVWAMQGTSTLDCPGLKGAVSFAGCH